METKPWIVFFSQTGGEIADIAKSLGKWPDRIYTNERPEHLREIDPRIVEQGFFTLPNKPTLEDYEEILMYFPEAIITLHGWLRIMPKEVCERFSIFNGHPGLITEYPELKGKDPQIRALKGNYPVMGCVLHKVVAGVDEGKVLAEERFNAFNMKEDEMWGIFKGRSLYMWNQFLRKVFGL